jgi:uncharacterized membrane protein
MMNRLLAALLLMLATIASVEAAATQGVILVNLHYDNGIITYNDKTIKCGFAPDYRLQPSEGFTAVLKGNNELVLTSFKFRVPNKIITEISDPVFKTISGGVVILNTTDFTLEFPNFDDAVKVEIYNPRSFKVFEVPLKDEQFTQERPNFWWLLLVILILIALYIIYKTLKKEPNKP